MVITNQICVVAGNSQIKFPDRFVLGMNCNIVCNGALPEVIQAGIGNLIKKCHIFKLDPFSFLPFQASTSTVILIDVPSVGFPPSATSSSKSRKLLPFNPAFVISSPLGKSYHTEARNLILKKKVHSKLNVKPLS